mgnify:CR=1 FL=1
MTQFQVMMLRGEDDRVDIWVGGVEVEVEASEKVDFEKARNFKVGDEPMSVAVGDFNGDGIPDLAVANFNSDNVSILINKTLITIIPNITISDTKLTEGNTNKTAKFTVTLDNPTTTTVKVNYTTANQTAKVNQD